MALIISENENLFRVFVWTSKTLRTMVQLNSSVVCSHNQELRREHFLGKAEVTDAGLRQRNGKKL